MHEETSRLTRSAIAALRGQLRGRVLLPSDSGYAVGRRVWNAAIDKHPAGIVLCADAEDVAFAMRVAGDNGLPVSIRGGGHNVAGRSVSDGALLLDLSGLRQVSVNEGARIATVQGGARWHEVDVATARHSLATTGGLISSTGVGGFTLGGGAGWLMRKHGLASDNLSAATVLLADGRAVRASPTEHPELFWGLRGGAGGLGVVASFELRVHQQREVLAGVVVHPASDGRRVLQSFRDFAAQAPDEFCGLAVVGNAPPFPFLNPEWFGRPVVILVLCWSGDPAAGERSMDPLRKSGAPLAEHVGIMPYVQWQHMQDPSAIPFICQYWKTASFTTLSDATIDLLVAAAHELPTPMTSYHVQHFGGAVGRFPARESAFANRDIEFFVNLMGVTPWSDEFPYLRERIKGLYDQITPQAMPRLLLPNFSNVDDGEVVTHLGNSTTARLTELRRRYDPNGFFTTPSTNSSRAT